jgi:hypothetical protein
MRGHKERGNKGEYGGCIFISIYENRRMKPVEIVLRKEGEGKRKNDGRGKFKCDIL